MNIIQNDKMFERTIKSVLDVSEKPQLAQWAFLSLQYLLMIFGATVLISFLTGLSISAMLLVSGIDTLLYILITKVRIPVYSRSSFAFITPTITGLSTHSLGDILVVLFMSGIICVIIGILIKLSGTAWLMKLLPPVVVGPVIMVIDLSLTPTAVNIVMYENPEDMKGYSISFLIVAMITLLVTIVIRGFFKGFLSLIPVFVGIIIGHVVVILTGIVRFDAITSAKWINFPHIYLSSKDYVPSLHLGLVFIIIPIASVTVSEHIGHQMVLNKIISRDFFEKPGLDKSTISDGVSTTFTSVTGEPPGITYGESIGVLTIIRIYSIYVIGDAAVIVIILAFTDKLTALISSIPTPVVGGVSILPFSVIATSDLGMLVESRVDFANNRDLVVASVVLAVGIGNLVFNLEEIGINLQIEGVTLAILSEAILNLILPKEKR